MKTSRSIQKVITIIGVFLLIAIVPGCEESTTSGPECGTGTVLDEETNTCIPSNGGLPDFNKSLDDMTIGDISLTNVEVPDELTEGEAGEVSFTITNNSIEDKPVTMVRMSLAKDYLVGWFEKYTQPGYGCTNTCAYKDLLNDGKCQDGGEGSTVSQCLLGTDCNDCGPRKEMWFAEGDELFCEEGFFPEKNTKVCHPATETIALIQVEDLKAGASQDIRYTINMPYFPEKQDFNDVIRPDGNHTLVFSVNEQWLTKDADGFVVADASQPKPVGAVDLELADGVVSAGTLRVHPAKTGMWFVKDDSVEDDTSSASTAVDTYAFELPKEAASKVPILTVTAALLSVRALRTDITAKLKLPGHDRDGRYRDDRSFDLLFPYPGYNAFTTERLQLPSLCEWFQNCNQFSDEDWQKKSIPHGQSMTQLFQVFLKPEDRNLLAGTLKNKAANPDLTDKNELHGTLQIFAQSENQMEPSMLEIDVVFMPPPANNDAGWTDPNAPPTTVATEDIKYATSFPNKTYPEVDYLTPEFFHKIGTDKAGAEIKVSNSSSKERLAQAVVKQAISVDNYAAINVFGLKLYLIKIGANVDWGTRRMLKDSIAQAEMSIIDPDNFSITSILTNAVTGGNIADNLTKMKSLLKVAFDFEEQCSTDNDNPKLETCTVIEEDTGEEEDPDFGITLNTPEPPSFPTGYSYTLSKEKEKEICYKGIICLRGKLEVALTVGINGKLEFFRDTTNDPRYQVGIEAQFGPYALADGTATGTLDIRLAAAGFEGNLNFFTADFKPTFIIGLEQQLEPEKDGKAACWMRNHGYVHFLGPVGFKALGGNVKFFVDLGPPPFDVGLFTVNLRYRAVDQEIVSWDPPINEVWHLWNELVQFRGGPGLCDDANTSTFWKSPTSCQTITGAAGYCPNSDKLFDEDKYSDSSYHGRFYTGPSQCGTITVNGNTEMAYDDYDGDRIVFDNNLTLTDESNCQMWWSFGSLFGEYKGLYSGNMTCNGKEFSGAFNDTEFKFCNTSGDDSLRYVDFWLATDDAISDTGVALTLNLDDVPEASFTTDKTSWWATSSSTPLDDSWNTLDYNGSDFDRPETGNQSAYGATIWATGSGSVSYFRRVFVASGEKMIARMNCDDECTVYLDGHKLGTAVWDKWKEFSFNTIPGEVHILAIESDNDNGGAYGVRGEFRVDHPVYSSKEWLVSRVTPKDDSAGRNWTKLNYETTSDFVAATEIGPFTLSTWNRGVTAPFDSNDASSAKWLWAAHDSLGSIAGEEVYFRRKFVAENSSYTAHYHCDNSCVVYIDGQQQASASGWESTHRLTVNTTVGKEHIIAIKAKNDNVGAAGMVWMMQ